MTLPYDYFPAVLYAIDLISKGNTKTAACDASNITIPTFDAYVNHDSDLQEMYDEAQQRGHDAMADALLSIDNHAIYGRSDPKMAKVQSDNIKWFLSKKRPKEYGDKVTVEVNVTADRAITDALLQGRKRVAALSFVEAEYVDVTPATDEEAEIAALIAL